MCKCMYIVRAQNNFPACSPSQGKRRHFAHSLWRTLPFFLSAFSRPRPPGRVVVRLLDQPLGLPCGRFGGLGRRRPDAQPLEGLQRLEGPPRPVLDPPQPVGLVPDVGEVPVHGVDLLLDPLCLGVVVEGLREGVLGGLHEQDHLVLVSGPVVKHL